MNQKLDVDLTSLETALSHLLSASQLDSQKDITKVNQELFELQGATINIARAVESILDTTSNMRQSVLLCDFAVLNKRLVGRLDSLAKSRIGFEDALRELVKDTKSLVDECNSVYFNSKWN